MRFVASGVLLLGLAVGVPCNADQKESSPKTIDQLRQLGRQIIPPRVIKQIEPEFSERARKKHIAGTVVVGFVVDEKGTPQTVKVNTSSNHALDRNALDAVRQWRFTPAIVDGTPTPVIMSVEVDFELY